MNDHAPLKPRPGWQRLACQGLLAVCIAGYAIFLARHLSPHAGGSDSSGYLNSARLLAHGEFLTRARALPGHQPREFGEMVFQPLGFRIQPQGDKIVPTYPIGLPLHLLAAAQIVGWHHAVLTVNLLTALASGGLVWALARRLGLPSIWAGAGVILLWLCPLFVFYAIQPMSDLLALGWALAVLYCALRVRDGWAWGLACGLSLGVAVLVRPTNALLVAPVLVALGFQWRSYLAVGLGGLPGAAVVLFYNWKVYGSPFLTGYGDVSSAFSYHFLAQNLAHFARWIPTLLSPLIIVAVAAPFLTTTKQRGWAMLMTWFVILTSFYAFYYNSGEEWWYLRFILPAFPVLIVAAMAGLAAAAQATRLTSGQTTALVVVMLALGTGWQARQMHKLDVLPFEISERSYPDSARWAQKNLPADAAVFCLQVSGAFFYYSDFLVIRWDQVTPGQYGALLAAIAERPRPIYAALFAFETPEALEKIGGHWTKLTTIGQVTFWQRQP